MRRIVAIATNTFREAVRDRVLLGVLLFATAVLLFALALGKLSLHQDNRVVEDLGLASVSFFAVLMAVFMGSSLLYKEIERKTLYVILPKPISRSEFLLGKYLGTALTACVFVSIMGGVLMLVMALQHDIAAPIWISTVVGLGVLLAVGIRVLGGSTWLLLPWSSLCLVAGALLAWKADADVLVPLASVVLSLGEVLTISAVAMLFSSFSTPFLTGGFTLGIWLAGRSANAMFTMSKNSVPEAIRKMLASLGHVLPNFNLFVPGKHALMTYAPSGGPWMYVAEALGYAGLYATCCLVAAMYLFQRRDLT